MIWVFGQSVMSTAVHGRGNGVRVGGLVFVEGDSATI